jgi:hypothetical protein
MGDRFFAVDVMIGYLLKWAKLAKLLDPFEGLARYEERLESRSAFPSHLYR